MACMKQALAEQALDRHMLGLAEQEQGCQTQALDSQEQPTDCQAQEGFLITGQLGWMISGIHLLGKAA